VSRVQKRNSAIQMYDAYLYGFVVVSPLLEDSGPTVFGVHEKGALQKI